MFQDIPSVFGFFAACHLSLRKVTVRAGDDDGDKGGGGGSSSYGDNDNNDDDEYNQQQQGKRIGLMFGVDGGDDGMR